MSQSQVTIGPIPSKRSRSASRSRRTRRATLGAWSRRKMFNSVTRVPRNMRAVGFPTNNVVKMKYMSVGQSLVGTVATVTYYLYSANSIYDPDRTNVGHQPSNHDTWQGLYRHYIVKSSTIKVTANCPSVSSQLPIAWGICLNDDVTPPSTTDHALIVENGSKYRILPAFSDTIQVQTMKYSPRSFFNSVKVLDQESRLGASFGSNPSEEAFFIVWMQVTNGTAGATMYFTAEVDYTVAMSEPKDFIQS